MPEPFPQKTILDYTLLRELGQGAQGAVFYAENSVGKPAAIKLIHPNFAYNTNLRERFRREADVMRKLDHRSICKAYDFYEDASQVAIVMEYLTGENLQQVIDRFGSVQPAKAIEWYRQLLPAFQYAHEQGVIHRDVKPSNILLTGENDLKVLDFSIAKALTSDEPLTGRLTTTRTMLGTPLYMSPEQIQTPKEIDFRTDIYSLGVLLYTLLAGHAPFDAPDDSLFSLHQQIVNQPIPKLPGIPPRLNHIIAKATAKDRNARYNSCVGLLHDLETVFPAPTKTKSLDQPVITPVDTRTTRIISPLVLHITAVITPALSAGLIGHNFRVLGQARQAGFWQIGAVASLLFTTVIFRLLGGAGLLVYVGFVAFLSYTIYKKQHKALAECRQQGDRYLSGWAVAGLVIGYYLVLFLLIGVGL